MIIDQIVKYYRRSVKFICRRCNNQHMTRKGSPSYHAGMCARCNVKVNF